MQVIIMLASLNAMVINGIEATPVKVEVDIQTGLPDLTRRVAKSEWILKKSIAFLRNVSNAFPFMAVNKYQFVPVRSSPCLFF